MKKNILYIITLVVFLFTNCDKDDDAAALNSDAKYTVTFSFNWNSQDFPTDYPSNAHFSKLIGWSHQTTSNFFQPGTLSSVGIKNMAEAGSISPLDDEIKAKIATGEGLSLFVGDGLGSGVGDITMNVEVNEEFPSVTLATMIAPSPDWYVAVLNINLLEGGQFIEEKTVTGLVYDSGTDSGVTFTSENLEINPREQISLLLNAPLGNGVSVKTSFASVRFTKQ